MKKLLIIVFALVATSASAQYYVGMSGGFAMPSATSYMGTELNGTTKTTEYGSFGEGMNFTLKAGYFFNDKFGVELAAGYLYGADQVRDYAGYDVNAYARVMRVAPTLVYNITDKVYGKFGAMVPVGGKTVAEIQTVGADGKPNGYVKGEQEFKGKFGMGVTGALGYKYSLGNNFSLFAELEYIGLSVDRDTSEWTEFNALGAVFGAANPITLKDLPYKHPVAGIVLMPKEYTYVDTLPTTNTDPSKVLGETAPYSSFGINFGITYTFGK